MDACIIDGYALEADFAAANSLSRRAVQFYRNEQDGLPFVRFGKRIYIPVEKARKWLERREQQHNPVKRRRRA